MLSQQHMKKIAFFIFILLTLYFRGFGQSYACNAQHWSATTSTIPDLEKVLAGFKWNNIDTLICDSFMIEGKLNHKWHEDFYNKQFGNYFSKQKHICFAQYYFREKEDSLIQEIHIIKFMLDKKKTGLFKKKYGSISRTEKTYRLKVQTFYKFVIEHNDIYFVSTESSKQPGKSDSQFNELFTYIATHQ